MRLTRRSPLVLLLAFLLAASASGFAEKSYAAEASSVAEPIISGKTVSIQKAWETNPVTAPASAKGVFVLNTEDGKLLSSKKEDVSMPAASLSKLMVIYLVHEKIASGKGSWGDNVKITDAKVESMSTTAAFSGTVRLKKGSVFTVGQLYQLTVIESNNAAAVQLGRWVSGSDKAFAKKMMDKASSLGMKKSKFVNACGLSNADYKTYLKMNYVGASKDENYMSPRDAATLASALINDYPEALTTTKTTSLKVKGTTIKTTNLLLTDKELKKKTGKYQVDGLKTGTTGSAGACLIATCQPEGRPRILIVIMNDAKRFNDAAALMEQAYRG